jgi:hypothetical protein
MCALPGYKPVVRDAHVKAWKAWRASQRAETNRVRQAQQTADHKSHVNAWKKADPAAWFRNQYRNNNEFNAKQKLRARLRKAAQPDSEVARLLAAYAKKDKWKAGWAELLGYGLTELVDHLRRTVPKRCSWADFLNGKLHIDHIVPRSLFDLSKAEELRACWSLSNLRLIPAAVNIKKGARRETLL